MNLVQLKSTVWIASGAVALGLVGYVALFVGRLDDLRAPPDLERVRSVLEDVPEPPKVKDDLIGYEDVKRLFHEGRGLNWTGQPPPKVVETTGPAVPVKQPEKKVADLLKVLLILVDSDSPEASRVIVRYLPAAGVPPSPGLQAYSYAVGDRLEKPHDYAHVESIAADGVRFSFDDSTREAETLSPTTFDAKHPIVAVGADGVRIPETRAFPVAPGTRLPPGQTRKRAPNLYAVGTEDAKYIGENYDQILSSEVGVRRHRDPESGRWDGVEITDLQPGSIAERHGAQAGDVLKSINGHPVTSVPEAINFVKNNSGKYSKWDVVVERLGKTVTITYETP